jgi:hypothetical protein
MRNYYYSDSYPRYLTIYSISATYNEYYWTSSFHCLFHRSYISIGDVYEWKINNGSTIVDKE